MRLQNNRHYETVPRRECDFRTIDTINSIERECDFRTIDTINSTDRGT